jgi:hypothetical protein
MLIVYLAKFTGRTGTIARSIVLGLSGTNQSAAAAKTKTLPVISTV